MWGWAYLYILTFSIILSLVLTPVARWFAYKAHILDRPSSRKIHSKDMPLLGGLAIFASFNITILLNFFLLLWLYSRKMLPPEISASVPGAIYVTKELLVILSCGLLVMLIGLVDDLRKVPARFKLLLQILVGLLLVMLGVKITFFLKDPFSSAIITILWVVGITNAFNLLDNMDGLSTGVALIASMIFFIVSYQAGQSFVSIMLLALGGSLIGFLRYNFYPSTIFMGDSGSLFIGYMMSVLTIKGTYYTVKSPTIMPAIMPVLILAIPIFDTLSVIYIRVRRRQSIFTGDKNHFSHRLCSLGMTQKQAVLFIYLVALAIGSGALLLNSVSVTGSLIILLQSLAIITIIIVLERAGGNAVR